MLQKKKNRIKQCGGFVTENRRVDGILALSRALGDCDLQPHVTYEPEIHVHKLEPDDEFLVLACDGVWDVMSNETCLKVIGDNPNPVKAASKIRDYAHCLGSTDNISVIVFKINPSSRKKKSSRSHRSHHKNNLDKSQVDRDKGEKT